MSKSNLKDLLEKSAQLVESHTVHLHKNLESIHEQTKKLSQKITRATDPIKGSLFLAGKGFDIEKYTRTASQIDLRTAFEPLELLSETDIEGYLKHEHNMIILTAIEEAKNLTSSEFYKNYNHILDEDWQVAKRDFIQKLELYKGSLGDVVSSDKLSVSRYRPQPTPTSGIMQLPFTPGRRGRSNMDSKMTEYATVVYMLNQYRKKENFFPLIQKFMEVVPNTGDSETRKREIYECFNILRYVLYEKDVANKGVITYGDDYKDGNKALLRHFADGAKRYLEKQYEDYMKDIIAQRVSQIEFDDNVQLIKTYLNIIYKRDTSKDLGYSPWELIYYCMRCGFLKDALEIAQKESAFISPSVVTALKAKIQNNLPPLEIETALTQEYRKNLESKDYFKLAVLLVLGRCEFKKSIPQVFSKTEDFLWLKLSLIEDSKYTLQDIQNLITSFGPSHFCPRGKNTLLYFKLLLLTIQFEEAIAYLCGREIDGYQVEAVHFAIVLHYYGVLNTPKSAIAPLLTEENGRKFLNFNFLIRDYVRLFAHTDVQNAVSYYYLIEDRETMFNYIKDLVTESGAITTLLGSIEKDGRRRRGFLEEFLVSKDIFTILKLVASEYEETGRYATAVDLLFMLEEFESAGRLVDDKRPSDHLLKILNIINRELSQVLIDGENRREIISLAEKIRQKFIKEKLEDKLRGRKAELKTFALLYDLTQFFDLCHTSKYNDALLFMEKLGIIPFDIDSVESKVQSFNLMDNNVRRRFADILFATMSCLLSLYRIEKQKPEMNQSQVLQELRMKANSLLTFAGLIQSQMSSDMYSRLIRMNVLMR